MTLLLCVLLLARGIPPLYQVGKLSLQLEESSALAAADQEELRRAREAYERADQASAALKLQVEAKSSALADSLSETTRLREELANKGQEVAARVRKTWLRTQPKREGGLCVRILNISGHLNYGRRVVRRVDYHDLFERRGVSNVQHDGGSCLSLFSGFIGRHRVPNIYACKTVLKLRF